MEDPYRSEIESLRAENERLKLELSKRRVAYPVLALVLVAVDLGLVVLLRPWLNGASDGAFWLSLGAVALGALAAVGAALGRRQA